MGSLIQTRGDVEPLPHVPVVLLCAEDDDLELVSFVHTARQHGLEPEVVPGVEDNGRPLRQAIAQNGDALFVVLRSDNLTQARTLALKRLFERRCKRGQHLLALRLEPTRSEHAVQTIERRLRELMKAPRPVTGSHATADRDHDSVPIDLGDLGDQQPSLGTEPETVWPPKAARVTAPHPTIPPDHPPVRSNSGSNDRSMDFWDDRTVVADHLPRPPSTVTEHTVVADHLPRPPDHELVELAPESAPEPDDPSGSDSLRDRPELLEHELEATLEPGRVESKREEQKREKSTNTGLWFALGLLALAAWHVATLLFGNSGPATAKPAGPQPIEHVAPAAKQPSKSERAKPTTTPEAVASQTDESETAASSSE